MKYLKFILVLILLSCLISSCRSFIYITQNFNTEIITDSVYVLDQEKLFRKVIEKKDNVTLVKTYSLDSILLSTERFSDYENLIHIGESNYYYPDGKIKILIEFDKNGYFDGTLTTYYQNRYFKRNDQYKHGDLISTICYDSTGNKINYYPYFIRPIANYSLFNSNIVYPENLKKKGIKEIVKLKILLNSKAKIVKIKYDNKNSPEFIKASIDALLKYLIITPCYIDGVPSDRWLLIPITFDL